GHARIAADVNGKIIFIGDSIRVGDRRRLLNIRKEELKLAKVHAHRDDNSAGRIPGSPEVIIIVRADGPRQTIRWAEVIDGAGFAIIGRENGSMSAVFSGQAV